MVRGRRSLVWNLISGVCEHLIAAKDLGLDLLHSGSDREPRVGWGVGSFALNEELANFLDIAIGEGGGRSAGATPFPITTSLSSFASMASSRARTRGMPPRVGGPLG